MKTCPVCQKFVTDQAKFCYYCGASLLNVEPDAPAPEPEIESQPVEEVAEPVAEAIEEPVAEAVEETVETVEAPVMEAVEEAVEAVEEPVEEVTETVEEPVAEAVEETVEAVEAPVAEPVEEVVEEPVEKALEPEPVAEPIPEPVVAPIVTPVAAPLQEPVVACETPAQTPPPQTVVQATDSRSLMTTAGYIFTTILFSIPIVGLIFMIVWGCGKPKNISRKRFSLACLIMRLIGVIAFLIVAVFLLICFSDKVQGWLHSIPM